MPICVSVGQREMTLDEYVNRLPAEHRASQELATLKRQLAEARNDRENLVTCREHLRAIVTLLPNDATAYPLDRICGAVTFTARMASGRWKSNKTW